MIKLEAIAITTFPAHEIIAYGAAAELAPSVHLLKRARLQAKYAYYAMRDRRNWQRSDLSHLDYRNYQDATTLNRGDQAITDAVVQKLHARDAQLRFRRVNWQRLQPIPDAASLVAICGGGYLFSTRTRTWRPE